MIVSFGAYDLDTERRELRRAGVVLAVEPKVFDLLTYLITHRERVLSKDELIANVWRGRIVSDSAVASSINAARTVLGDSGYEHRVIKTYPRKGVRFVGEITAVDAGPALPGQERTELTVPRSRGGDKASFAVLPFTNLSEDPAQEYFAEVVAEEIT